MSSPRGKSSHFLEHSLRSNSLLFHHGPGGLAVLLNGETAILPGLDAWYVSKRANRQIIPNDALLSSDRKLEEALQVDSLVMPPHSGLGINAMDSNIPVELFPKWVTCNSCYRLEKLDPSSPTIPTCSNCSKKGRMLQTNFVVVCKEGHIDDFPWVAWVHKGAANSCGNPQLLLRTAGISQLGSQRVECSCGKKRSLAEAQGQEIGPDGGQAVSGLSARLDPTSLTLCSGSMPWLRQSSSSCDKDIWLALRSQANLYFPHTMRTFFLPDVDSLANKAIDLIRTSPRNGRYQLQLMGNDFDYDFMAKNLKQEERLHYSSVSKDELVQALSLEFPQDSGSVDESDFLSENQSSEYDFLSRDQDHASLVVRSEDVVEGTLGLSKVNAVSLLEETTVFTGFSRLEPQHSEPFSSRSLLRRNPHTQSARWLPAVRYRGEGIFVELDPHSVESWESQSGVRKWLDTIPIADEASDFDADYLARFMLLHTFSHLIIQQLAQTAGYAIPSLTEKVFAANNQSGVIIYTTSSSGDGTMGGLVSMAELVGFIEQVNLSIEEFSWCSNDPVCREGAALQQQSEVTNKAACHNCCLLPETSCKYFNKWLDRCLLLGGFGVQEGFSGYFEMFTN